MLYRTCPSPFARPALWLAAILAILTTRPLPADAPSTAPAAYEDIDAAKQPPDKQFPKSDVVFRRRPWTAADHRGTLLIENLKIHGAINQKAIDIALVSPDKPSPVPGEMLTFAKVIVRNCELYDINRDETGRKLGLHIDFLRIAGDGDRQDLPTDVLIENVRIHDGDALPIMIQDGNFGAITLRNVRVDNTTRSVQISAVHSGRIREVIVEDCPNLKIGLMGRPGSIEKCVLRDSPGASATDTPNVNGRSDVRIVDEGTGRRPVAKLPATIGSRPPGTAPTTAQGPLELQVGTATAGLLDVALVGKLPDNLAFVIFEAFDKDDYRIDRPVVVTEPPWQAKLRIKAPGRYRLIATVKNTGGDPAPRIANTVDVTAPQAQGAGSGGG